MALEKLRSKELSNDSKEKKQRNSQNTQTERKPPCLALSRITYLWQKTPSPPAPRDEQKHPASSRSLKLFPVMTSCVNSATYSVGRGCWLCLQLGR